jgi:hypothetical protein
MRCRLLLGLTVTVTTVACGEAGRGEAPAAVSGHASEESPGRESRAAVTDQRQGDSTRRVSAPSRAATTPVAPVRDACERAYIEVVERIVSAPARPGDHGPAPTPDEGRFMEACGAVPADARECLVMSYAMGHAEECRDRVAALDAPTRARADALMRAALGLSS